MPWPDEQAPVRVLAPIEALGKPRAAFDAVELTFTHMRDRETREPVPLTTIQLTVELVPSHLVEGIALAIIRQLAQAEVDARRARDEAGDRQ